MDKRAQNIIAIFLERAQAYEVPKPFAAGVDHVGEAENETKADTYRIAADVVEKTFKDRETFDERIAQWVSTFLGLLDDSEGESRRLTMISEVLRESRDLASAEGHVREMSKKATSHRDALEYLSAQCMGMDCK